MIVIEIRKYMEKNGIKQVFLSQRTGLTRNCISMLLTGRRKLSIEEYIKICTALDLPYDYFFERNKKGIRKES